MLVEPPNSLKPALNSDELIKAMAEMKRFGEEETTRRQQLEKALQEANNLFKRELATKNEELADLHAELGYPSQSCSPKLSSESKNEV